MDFSKVFLPLPFFSLRKITVESQLLFGFVLQTSLSNYLKMFHFQFALEV